MTPPSKIRFKTDGNELEFRRTTIQGKEKVHIYQYIKSSTKIGFELPLTEGELEKIIRNEIVEII